MDLGQTMNDEPAQKLRDVAESAISTVANTKEGDFVDIDYFVKRFESALTELVEES